jgi:hypothetical protein
MANRVLSQAHQMATRDINNPMRADPSSKPFVETVSTKGLSPMQLEVNKGPFSKLALEHWAADEPPR